MGTPAEIRKGKTCEICGKDKRNIHAFCVGCYKLLPENLRYPLFKRPGEGFEEAYREAKEYLLMEADPR